ncbi:hypothetical protein [Gynurincola endophyticus]|jgi:hypothetical protein|uniref:hypothetical protein n=1 Tax=Gynurincola endophyticus TaxID=2479004 RepID=UPI000F8D3CCA|nr:hypothetical protein [Gynurincola endophyticus]
MDVTPAYRDKKLESGIRLLSAYALSEKMVISEQLIEECANAVHLHDPLLRLCFAARSIGINAAVQEVYTTRPYIDRDEVWLVEKDDRMLLLDTPVWNIAFRVFDSVNGLHTVTKKHLAHYLDFSATYIPYRVLVLDRASLRKWSEANGKTYWSERRRWFTKNSGWMAFLGMLGVIMYLIVVK